MGNLIIKLKVLIVVTEVGSKMSAIVKKHFSSLPREQNTRPPQTGAFIISTLVEGVTQTGSELLRGTAGCRPRGGDLRRQSRLGSQFLFTS